MVSTTFSFHDYFRFFQYPIFLLNVYSLLQFSIDILVLYLLYLSHQFLYIHQFQVVFSLYPFVEKNLRIVILSLLLYLVELFLYLLFGIPNFFYLFYMNFLISSTILLMLFHI